MVNFEDIAPSKLLVLANSHINRFRNMIASGGRNINRAECQMYIHVWESVREAKGEWEKLSPEAQREIKDAAYSREYDDVLGLDDDSFES
jgi:hypothetical protein